jgi:hypothetical protein
MDKNMLLEMAKLITIQQAEIDRLKALMPDRKKNKKKLDPENKARRLSLIAKMYSKQWEKILSENSDHISFLNQQLLISGLSPFKPTFDVGQILKNFR